MLANKSFLKIRNDLGIVNVTCIEYEMHYLYIMSDQLLHCFELKHDLNWKSSNSMFKCLIHKSLTNYCIGSGVLLCVCYIYDSFNILLDLVYEILALWLVMLHLDNCFNILRCYLMRKMAWYALWFCWFSDASPCFMCCNSFFA